MPLKKNISAFVRRRFLSQRVLLAALAYLLIYSSRYLE